MFFVMSLRLSDHKVLHNIASSSRLFRFRSDFLAFSLVFRTSNFWNLRNLIKQLFHSRLLNMRLVIANSALRAIYKINSIMQIVSIVLGVVYARLCLSLMAILGRLLCYSGRLYSANMSCERMTFIFFFKVAAG